MAVDISADQVHGPRDHHQLIALKKERYRALFLRNWQGDVPNWGVVLFCGGGRLPAEMKRGIVFVLPDKLRGV